jgi:hypothetical protein
MQPKQVTASNLASFIGSAEITVIRVTTRPGIHFNAFLEGQLKAAFPGRTKTGCLHIRPNDYRNTVIKEFLRSWIPKIGLAGTNSILPGYYLFQKGSLLAYHPGTIDLNQTDLQVQKVTFIAGSILGILIGLLEKSTLKGVQTFAATMEAPTGMKVFEFFKKALYSKTFNYSQQQKHAQQDILDEEIKKAYKLLNVLPTATDAEVRRARNIAIKAVHPDKNGLNQEACNQLTAEINNAYELITKSRAKARAKAA